MTTKNTRKRARRWVGHKVYEPLVHKCGFQKSGEERNAELKVLETAEGRQLTA
jgi:hypothetical protein